MENLNDIENLAKVVVGIIGVFAAFGKLRVSFNSYKRKQELKIDLEIFEKLKENVEFDSSNVEEDIGINLEKAFDRNTDGLRNIFIGIVVFIGFGLWSIDIFQNSETFNGWVILTLFTSLIGLSMIFGKEEKNKEKGLFF